MTPEQLAQFNDMKERLENLESAQNPSFVESLGDVQITKRDDFDGTGLTGIQDTNPLTRTTTTVVSGDGGTVTVTHLEAPDHFIYYRYKNKTYRLWANELV